MIVGVLSDAHGHIGAFDAAIAALRSAGAAELFYLGDAVGYIPETGVIERLRALGIPALKGNHEAMMLSPEYEPEKDAVYQLLAARAQIDPEALSFIGALKARLERTIGGARCLFVHGSPADSTFGYVYPDTSLRPFAETGADVVFMGHTHRPFIRAIGRTLFVNVGSCALPRDGDGRGAACLFDTDSGKATTIRYSIARSSREALERYRLHDSVAALMRRSAAVEDDV